MKEWLEDFKTAIDELAQDFLSFFERVANNEIGKNRVNFWHGFSFILL